MLSPTPRTPTARDRELGVRLKTLRKERGLTMQDLAEHLGVSWQQYDKYERGINRMPYTRLLDACATLDVNIVELDPSNPLNQFLIQKEEEVESASRV